MFIASTSSPDSNERGLPPNAAGPADPSLLLKSLSYTLSRGLVQYYFGDSKRMPLTLRSSYLLIGRYTSRLRQ